MHKKFLANKKRRTITSLNAEKDNDDKLISQIITGVHNASQNYPRLAGVVTHFPINWSRGQVSAMNRKSTSSNRNDTEDRSLVIYDQLGNLITNT